MSTREEDEAFAKECAVDVAHAFEESGIGSFVYRVVLRRLEERRAAS